MARVLSHPSQQTAFSNNVAIAAIAFVIAGSAGSFILRPDITNSIAGEAATTTSMYVWKLTDVGFDKTTGAPRTQVTLKIATSSYPAGTYSGNCTVIDSANLRQNEKAAVACWWEESGKEIGLFGENDALFVKLADLGQREPTFSTLSEIGKNARIRTIYARIAQGASAFGIKIVPLEVLEDSRCSGTACARSGILRVKVELTQGEDSKVLTFALDQPLSIGQMRITLTAVEPQRPSGEEIDPSAYRFAFRIER